MKIALIKERFLHRSINQAEERLGILRKSAELAFSPSLNDKFSLF